MLRAFRSALMIVFAVAATLFAVAATEHHGQVTFNGLPVPGATVIATQAGKKWTAITDLDGFYAFADLADGPCEIDVQMPGFALLKQSVTITANSAPSKWELKLLPLEAIGAEVRVATTQAPAAAVSAPNATAKSNAPGASDTRLQSPAQLAAQTKTQQPAAEAQRSADDEFAQRAADGLLINGSQNNGAASPFGQMGAFGNNRFGMRRLYNGGIGFILDNSAFDAAPYSLAGQSVAKPAYNRTTGTFTFGGPLRIPHLWRMPPSIFVGYQWTRNNNAITQSALMPTQAERGGVFTSPIIDPHTGQPFANNSIPQQRMNRQALALLNLYPLPNVAANARYNYQIPIVSPTHQDALQFRWNKLVTRNDQLFGNFAFQSTRSTSANVLSFADRTSALGLNAGINWSHRLSTDWFILAGYQFSRLATHITPNFADRVNISGQAGITGNDQTAANWGPPVLSFSSGIAGVTDAQSAIDRNQTSGVSYSMQWNRRTHNVTFGTDYRRREFNSLAQQDPRGSFAFTGAMTGSAFADFLLGLPDTVSIAYGNADKYFRQSLYDAYVSDDWRMNAKFTFTLGLRWEYGAPITELRDRLVNLDVAKGFTAASAVLAGQTGAVTGRAYPNSLVEPDKAGLQPRIGIAWRPIAASSLVVRAGYGLYYDTSVYQVLAEQMAQQPPLSRTLSLQNTPALGLTLANAFTAPAVAARNTFAVDRNYRVGRAHTWNFSVQQNLPGALQLLATYAGIRGTHGLQASLPNTYPIGAVDPCPACPAGFVYLQSTGNSSRESGQVQLRRRLHSGVAGSLQYTYSKSIDDMAAFGGLAAPGNSPQGGAASNMSAPPSLAIAQNWLDLRGDRGLSPFDQRHVLAAQVQYTSGMGIGGGTLMTGRAGALLKQWTVSTQISAGSGLPQTPLYLAPVPGTGFTGVLRPDVTGAPLYAAPAGLFLNPAAYSAPIGNWGDASRSSITGPATFGLNASLGRAFQVKDRYTLDFRLDATNALNHVTYRSWNVITNSAQFGLPIAANAMRSLQTTLRLRF